MQKGCGTSGDPGCSPSWSTPSRPCTRPTPSGSTDAAEQYTILDGLKLLSDGKFRAEVLGKVSDPYLAWSGGTRDFDNWHRQYRSEAHRPGADPPGLLRIVQEGEVHLGPVPLHH